MAEAVRVRTDEQKKLMNEDKVLDIHTAVYDGVESYFKDESNLCSSNVNAQTNKGWTPLMVACNIKGRTSIAEILLKSGADVNLKNHEGWTARELAEFFKRDEIENLFRQMDGSLESDPDTLHPSSVSRPDWCKCGSCLPQDCKEKEICCYQFRDKIKKRSLKRFAKNKCITTAGSFKDTSLNKLYLDTNFNKFTIGSKPSTIHEYFELACKVFKENFKIQSTEDMGLPACVLKEIETIFPSKKRTDKTERTKENLDETYRLLNPKENITDEDIVSLANKETGEFEIDFCFEDGLYNTNWETCKKNYGHPDFIPIDEFTVEKLPENFRDKDTYGLIKALSELTVHITVGYASPDRPSKVNDKPYPQFSARNRWTPRYGSGRVWDAEKVENEPCQCSVCKTSDKPCMQWAKISILTAMHLIFDQSEAEKTKFKLGFNKDGDTYETLEGYKVFKTTLDEDMCYLYSISHSVELVDELKKHLEEFEEKCRNVNAKYKKTDNVKLTAIVSHPHGYFKRVTVGNWEVQEPQRNKSTRYEYTTATCKGSSGAPVFVFGKEKGWWLTHHHSGCDKTTKYNYSGIIWL